MSGIINKVENALHLNKNHGTATTGTTHTTHNNGVPEGTAGPHSSRVANAADPRVDSDLDSSRAGYGTTGTTHTTHTTHNTHNNGVPEGTAGPHSSRLANAADPRVDSDLDSSRGHHDTHTSAPGSGITGTSGSTTTPHNSSLLNKADPRVDTTSTTGAYSNTNNGVAGTHGTNHHTGTVGGISNSTNAGPHDSNVANKLDPRVDSDLDSTGNRHGASTRSGAFGVSGSHATPGSGTAQNTAGPHNSDLLNKLDPRVDADLDGSKTYGGNKTHA